MLRDFKIETHHYCLPSTTRLASTTRIIRTGFSLSLLERRRRDHGVTCLLENSTSTRVKKSSRWWTACLLLMCTTLHLGTLVIYAPTNHPWRLTSKHPSNTSTPHQEWHTAKHPLLESMLDWYGSSHTKEGQVRDSRHPELSDHCVMRVWWVKRRDHIGGEVLHWCRDDWITTAEIRADAEPCGDQRFKDYADRCLSTVKQFMLTGGLRERHDRTSVAVLYSSWTKYGSLQSSSWVRVEATQKSGVDIDKDSEA